MPVTVNKKFTVDLCPKKPNPLVMNLGDTRVVVDVSITAKQKPAPIVLDRLIDKAAMPVIVHYQKTVQAEVNRLQDKFLQMVKARNAKGATELANTTTHAVKNACASLQGAVEDAVKKQVKIDYRDDQNLLEAQIKVGLTISFKVIAIGKDLAQLTVSAGADPTAWLSLAKNIYGLATVIQQEAQDEKATRKDLLTAVGKYCTDKQRRVIEAEKAKKSNKAALELAFKDIYRKFAPESKKVEEERKRYKNKVTKMRHNLEGLSKKTAGLEAEMKKAKTLKEGVKLGAHVMNMKRNVKTTYVALQKAETFADDMAFLLTEAGIKVDDRTFMQKLRAFDNIPDLVSLAKDLKDAASDIQDIVGAFA